METSYKTNRELKLSERQLTKTVRSLEQEGHEKDLKNQDLRMELVSLKKELRVVVNDNESQIEEARIKEAQIKKLQTVVEENEKEKKENDEKMNGCLDDLEKQENKLKKI